MPLNTPITQWRGRTVWIIGASSGIGLALAGRLVEAGATVLVSARNGAALAAWSGTHHNAFAYPLDVTREADIATQWAALVARHGTPDVVVYAAGHYAAQRASAWDAQESRRHCEINYLGAVDTLARVVPAMLARGSGHIALIASVAGYRGLPQALAYGPTKAALINLAEVLHHDLAGHGVDVSLINPGFVETPLTARNTFAMPALITAPAAAAYILRGWALGRFEIHFPRRFTWWLKLARALPYWLYFGALRRIAP